MPPPAPELMHDLVQEILLRLPPEDPGCLFRATVVCKRWRGLLTGRAFGRRYRQFHRSPPLLGFFENQYLGCWFAAPSSPASPVPPIHPGRSCPDALDARHGLVLLDLKDRDRVALDYLAVWDPLRRRQWEFPYPHQLAGPMGFRDYSCSAAVLCAADGCDHLDCRGAHGARPFLVVCVCIDGGGGFHGALYSSEAGAWSPVSSVEHPFVTGINPKPKVLVGNALYFTCDCEPTLMIVRYDLASRELSIINGPAGSHANLNQYVLVETDNGVLGFANLQGSTLCVWSTEASADGRTLAWGEQRVVELEKLLPPHAFSAEPYVTGFTEADGVIVLTNAGTFTIELKSGRVKNVPGRILHAFPYSSFYTPDQAGGIIPHLPTASPENSEVGQHPLLQLPSMDSRGEREEDDDDKEEGEDDDNDEEESEWKDDENDEEESEWKEDDDDDDEELEEEMADNLAQAQERLGWWSKAIMDGDFDFAQFCASDVLECRFLCHGKLSPKCAYIYYIHGCTSLYKPHPDSEPSSERGYDVALKMLHIARRTLDKCSGSGMEKVKICSALADVKILSALGRGPMRREDIDYTLRICFRALAISEHLIEPDNYWIIKLNVSICLVFEFASNIEDAVAYCEKAISLCKSRISNLNKNASAAEEGSQRSALDYEIEFLTGMSCKLEKKLEHLEQAKPTPTTMASGEQNVGDAMPRAASSTPLSNLLELLSIFEPVLLKTSCTPIWPELQDV